MSTSTPPHCLRAQLVPTFADTGADGIRTVATWARLPQNKWAAFQTLPPESVLVNSPAQKRISSSSVANRVQRKGFKDHVKFGDLSDGEKQYLMVLGLLRFTREDETLFLLDEPDTHLHPRWQA